MTVHGAQAWQSFNDRNAGRPADPAWYEGVPEWLEYPLREWLSRRLHDDGWRQQVMARLRYIPRDRYWYGNNAQGVPTHSLLEWVDATLHAMIHSTSYMGMLVPDYVGKVDAVLRDGRSVWKVGKSGDFLERRHDSTVTAAARETTESAVRAGRDAGAAHLQTAWDAAYRLHPDPSTAYREAILAVEAAAIPVVVPNQAGATLGHVLGQLDRQGHLYQMAINDRSGVSQPMTVVVQMIRLLWDGHTDRHEGVTRAVPITREAAQMATHAAVTLVQWFTSGAIRRR
ncbi:hypothetical protein NONO_c33320 [Nocardia nova SH22a]|uniref:Uncharacterized protein n=1 Tax=Nocardia nova SH22a TaxID=1415166 RepID=W5TG24_9NOCA|nr:hypothetical protein [Nocardia nova]AHH18119.1 hypothetical protein NONO_c33320 [Nocardia nova SH22a]